MKKILLCLLSLLTLTLLSQFSNAFEEKTLPSEVDPRPNIEQKQAEPFIIFEGYVNSHNVTVIADMMSCVYYFCRENKASFCDDMEGVILVSALDKGKGPEMLKKLDAASEENNKIRVMLSTATSYSGISKILDVQLLGNSGL